MELTKLDQPPLDLSDGDDERLIASLHGDVRFMRLISFFERRVQQKLEFAASKLIHSPEQIAERNRLCGEIKGAREVLSLPASLSAKNQ